MKQLIIINGPSCVWKSTTIEAFLPLAPKWYHLSYDRQKWLFSQYRDHIDEYRPVIWELILHIAEKMMSLGYSVISDSVIRRESREKLIATALKYDYTVREINLEAPWEVINTRFVERLERNRSNPTLRMANTSIDRLRELYDLYENEKNTDALTFRTDILAPDVIIESITNIAGIKTSLYS